VGQLSLTESHSISSEATEFAMLRYSTLFHEHDSEDICFALCVLLYNSKLTGALGSGDAVRTASVG